MASARSDERRRPEGLVRQPGLARLGDSDLRRDLGGLRDPAAAIIVFYSFFTIKNYQVVYEPTVATWISLIESGRWIAALRTLRVVFTITAIEFLIAFPFALWLAKGCRSKTAEGGGHHAADHPVLPRCAVAHHHLAGDPRHQRHHQHRAAPSRPDRRADGVDAVLRVRGPFRHDRALLPDHGVPDLPGPDPDRRRIRAGEQRSRREPGPDPGLRDPAAGAARASSPASCSPWCR